MDREEKSLPPTPSQRTYRESENQQSSGSRNYYELEASRISHPVRGATYPEPSTSSTSARPGDSGRSTSTAVQPSTSTTSGRSLSHQATLQKSISRKPVERRATSESSTSSEATATRLNTDLQAARSLLTPTSNTSMLFNQASRSLTSLTREMNDVDIQDSTESPPPYADGPAQSTPSRDIKQPNSSLNEEPSDAIQLVRENRLDLLERMVDQGFTMDDVDPITKRTAIMEAANLRRNAAARILLRSNCRLHLKDIDGWSALHFACSQGDAEICQMLLDAGAQLDEYSNSGESPLILAARGGHTDVVLCLLNSWAAQMSNSTSLLNGFLEAVKSGNVRTAEVFIERGINPKKVQDSWRPVIYAAQSGSIPMIDFLFTHKCSIKQRDPEGRNALHFAASLGHTAMVERLLAFKLPWNTQTKNAQETPLHYAALAKQSSTAMALILHRSANITARDTDGVQAIHHTTRNGDIPLTTTLLNKGAKLDDQTRFGWTPMLLACAYGQLPLVAEFITRGANLEERLASPSVRPREKTNEAARRGYWAEIRWPHPGARPLHIALEFGQDDVANMLIAAGARVDETDSEGWRPLHYAAFNARSHMVELLLNKSCSPHATTAMGNTPLSLGFREAGSLATYEEKMQVTELLQAAMNAHKKSKFRRVSDAMTAPLNKSREVGDRNKIWHTAQLADALYQSVLPEVHEDEEARKLSTASSNQYTLTTTVSNQYTIDNDDDSGYGDSRTSEPPLRITKTMTD